MRASPTAWSVLKSLAWVCCACVAAVCLPPPLGRSPLYALWCNVYGVNSEHLKRRVFFSRLARPYPLRGRRGFFVSLTSLVRPPRGPARGPKGKAKPDHRHSTFYVWRPCVSPTLITL